MTEADLDALPDAARRYLGAMGVVGRPRDWSFLVEFIGRFRLRGRSWMPCHSWQYNASYPLLRTYHMRIDFGRVVPMVGQDTYVDGRGAMRGKLLGLVTVADGHGPEFDLGELATYLNDAVLLAPSMLLGPAVTWSAVDDASFTVSLTDHGHRVTATVTVDEAGLVTDFSTEDRWCDLPGGLVRARWTTPVAGWSVVDGRPWPTGARAQWHLPDGVLPYVEGEFVAAGIVRNVLPAEVRPG